MASFHNRTFGQPSQDTIFIRGFSIRQDVDDIRDYFYDEGRCSVVFFKENQHFQKLFIALKFESVSIAKKVMKKYNDAEVMGDWLQLTWFKKAIYGKDDEYRHDDYRHEERRQPRRRYESRSRSRSRGRTETPPRRRRNRTNSASEEDRKKIVNKETPKRPIRRQSSSSESDAGSSSIVFTSIKNSPLSNNHSKISVYKEPPTIWNKPEKIDIVMPTMKNELKREIPEPVPAPPISENGARSGFNSQIVTNNGASDTIRTIKAKIETPSSPEYSSPESEPELSPPIKIKKRKSEKMANIPMHMKAMKGETPPVINPAFSSGSAFQSSSFGTTRVHSSFMQNSNTSLSADLRQKVSNLSSENVNLVKTKKEDIEMSYRQDCDTFSMVVRMLINKDPSLEPILQPSLKENLKCIGTKCIFELRDYIEQLRNDSINDIF